MTIIQVNFFLWGMNMLVTSPNKRINDKTLNVCFIAELSDESMICVVCGANCDGTCGGAPVCIFST